MVNTLDLAPIPDVDAALVERHTEVRRQLADQLATADDVSLRVFRHVQHRLISEHLARIDPVAADVPELLVPPKRRLLSSPERLRLQGCAAALNHIDVRLTMVKMGLAPGVLEHETPMVLNALVEAPAPSGDETNAGIVRAKASGFAPGGSAFRPPPPERCRPLLRAAIEMAAEADVPGVVRAGWLLGAVFAIHPFADGNGRTGRLMLHALLSEAAPVGFDWGTPVALTQNRAGYQAAAQAYNPSLTAYDAAKLDPRPLIEFVAESGIEGDLQAGARLAAIRTVVDAAISSGLDEPAAALLVAVAADRNSSLDELGSAGDAVTEGVMALVAAGRLGWDERGKLQVVGPNPFLI